MSRILIIEDDQRIAGLIRLYLEREGHITTIALDGREGLRLFGSEQPDLVLLDLMLPGIHGKDVCRAIRTHSATPILMLTALDDERDVIEGLDLGADDYITKPFKPREMVARVRAALRRSAGTAKLAQEVEVGDIVLNLSSRLMTIAERPVELRTKEFDLLLALAEHPRVVLTREQLLSQVWGREYDVDTRTVDVHINRLRNRLAGSHCEIETVRGIGYRLTPPDDERGQEHEPGIVE